MKFKGTVLRVASDVYPLVIGGVGVHVIELTKSLIAHGWRHIILTLDHFPDLKLDNYCRIITDKSFISLRGNKLSPFFFNKVVDILKKYEVDIIHAHSHVFYSSNIVALIRKVYPHYPLIITCHGIWSQSIPLIVQKLYMRTIGLFTLNSADKVLCYTDEEKELLVSMGVNSSKIEVIPNAINTEIFTPEKSKRKNNNILWIGRLVPGKKPELAIKIIAELNKDIPDVTLTMIGDGPLKHKCVRLTKNLGLENNIRMINFIPYKMMPKIYQAADVLLITSAQEGVPRVMLEAMACEVPVIMSSKLWHIRSLIKGCGMIFDAEDISSAVIQLKRLLASDNLRLELGRKGRAKVIKEHSWEIYTKRIEKIYEKLLK